MGASLNNELTQFTALTEKYGFDNFFDFDVFVSSLSSDVVTSTRMLQCVTEEKEQLDNRCIQLQTQLKNSSNIQDLDAELEHMRNEMALRDSTIIEKDSEIDEKNDIITEKLCEIERLQESISKYEDEAELGRYTNEGTNSKAHREEIESLNETIETLQHEMKHMKIIEEQHIGEIEAKHSLIGELNSQIVEAQESANMESEALEKSGSLEVEMLREKVVEK